MLSLASTLRAVAAAVLILGWFAAAPAVADDAPAKADAMPAPTNDATPATDTVPPPKDTAAPAVADAATPSKPAPQSTRPVVHKRTYVYRVHRAPPSSWISRTRYHRGGGYVLYERPYRMTYVFGYETGNDIGFQGLEFNPPGTDNRGYGYHAVTRYRAYRRAVHSPLCRPTGWVSGECW
jgi:hypothetical protein